MIDPQWLELPISGTSFDDPKDVQAIEVQLYFDRQVWANRVNPDQMLQNAASELSALFSTRPAVFRQINR